MARYSDRAAPAGSPRKWTWPIHTFKQCAEAYINAHRAAWRNGKHAGQWSATLSAYAYPIIGALPVQAVDTGLVLKVLEPIWTAKPETASRVRAAVRCVFGVRARSRANRERDTPNSR
jgi:hypothetical protein